MSRWLAVAAVALGASCGGDHDASKPAPGSAPPVPAAPVDGSMHDCCVGAPTPGPTTPPPAAIVTIGASNELAVFASHGDWDRVAHPPGDAVRIASPELLPRAVLAAVIDDGGKPAALAEKMIAELDGDVDAAPTAQYGTIGNDDLEVSMTYLGPSDDLPATTPLVVFEARASAQRVVAVLDAVGGRVAGAADVPGSMPLAAPFAHAGYGGLDVDPDAPAIDLMLGPGGFATGGDAPPHLIEAGAVSALDPRPEATIDVLVTPEVTAGQMWESIARLHDATRSTIGLGNTTSPWPRFAMDGNLNRGPIGLGTFSPKWGAVTANSDDYAPIARRYLRRASPRFGACSDAHGLVSFSFDVDTKGKVSDAKAAGSSCVAATITAIELAAPKAKVHVSGSITFP